MRVLCAALALCVPALGLSQVLSTTTPNNGSGGIFMNLTPVAGPLNVTSFDTYFSGAVGLGITVQIYTRPGSYVGFTGSNVGWTLFGTGSATAAGTSVLAPMSISAPIFLASGQTTAVYLHSITTGGGIRYTGTGTAPPQTTWSNADLTLFSDVSRTGAVAFAGTAFTPRCFAGNVHYESAVPEPATLATLGLGALALLRRRRRA